MTLTTTPWKWTRASDDDLKVTDETLKTATARAWKGLKGCLTARPDDLA